MNKIWAKIKLEWEWLKVPNNRKKAYKFLKAVAPILIAAGFISPNEAAQWLELVSGVLLLGTSTVADRNVNEND